MAQLNVEHLSKTRAYDEIFSNISFTLNSSELLWLKGANGSGKTSLMRVLAGLSQASDGLIESKVTSFHYISHQLNLIESFSVAECLEKLYPLYGIPKGRDINEVLSNIGIAGTESQRIGQLSAGQKQRLNLLLLCLDDRQLWLLDEPYSNLDNEGRRWLDTLIQKHLAADGMVIITSHSESLGVNPDKVLELSA